MGGCVWADAFVPAEPECRESTLRIVSQLFVSSVLLDRVLVWGFERQLNDFSLHVHQFSPGTVIHKWLRLLWNSVFALLFKKYWLFFFPTIHTIFYLVTYLWSPNFAPNYSCKTPSSTSRTPDRSRISMKTHRNLWDLHRPHCVLCATNLGESKIE